MKSNRAWLVTAAGGVIVLVFVSAVVREPALRVGLSLLAIVPLLYATVRVALGSERRAAQERRRFVRLRSVTDEFIMSVRNLNRLTLAGRMEEPPENVDEMIEEIVTRMHGLVDRIRLAAGEEETQ